MNHIAISSKQIAEVYNSLSHLAFDDMQNSRQIMEVDFKAIVEKSIEFYALLAKSKQMPLEATLEKTTIMIDKNDAQKLINNLLSNAVKYNTFGKTIHITLQDKRLCVKDQGIGISKEDQKAILKRYHRGDNQQGGFGIGLDIVNSITHRYEISLHIDSQKGQGSRFCLDFSPISVKT